MYKLEKKQPWIFWPDSICNTFPEHPGNKILDGSKTFKLQLKIVLEEITNIKQTIFSLLPSYIGLDIQNNASGFVYTLDSKANFIPIDDNLIPINEELNIVLEYIYKKTLSLSINNKVVLLKILNGKKLGYDSSPHIILGAGNFPKNGFNLNYSSYYIKEFCLFDENKCISHHTFDNFIHDKSFDLTNNCNFLHKL